MEEIIKTEHGSVFYQWDGGDQTMEQMDAMFKLKTRELFENSDSIHFDLTYAESDCPMLYGNNAKEIWLSGAVHVFPFKKTIPEKEYRIRLAYHINYISKIYDTLRKLNFAYRLDLKEDLVNQTVLYFLENWDKYEFHPYAIPTAVQKFKGLNIDTYRKEKKNTSIDEYEDTVLPPQLKSIEGLPLEELEEKEEFETMKNAISTMEEPCREILMLVADGKSESEIQKILNIPLGTVSSRKSNCIKKLANIINL